MISALTTLSWKKKKQVPKDLNVFARKKSPMWGLAQVDMDSLQRDSTSSGASGANFGLVDDHDRGDQTNLNEKRPGQ